MEEKIPVKINAGVEFLERAIDVQRKKIEQQRLELARMTNVYQRSVRSAKVSEACKFLIDVILNKLKIK